MQPTSVAAKVEATVDHPLLPCPTQTRTESAIYERHPSAATSRKQQRTAKHSYRLVQHETQGRMLVDDAAEVMQGEKMHEEKRREEDTKEGNDR